MRTKQLIQLRAGTKLSNSSESYASKLNNAFLSVLACFFDKRALQNETHGSWYFEHTGASFFPEMSRDEEELLLKIHRLEFSRPSECPSWFFLTPILFLGTEIDSMCFHSFVSSLIENRIFVLNKNTDHLTFSPKEAPGPQVTLTQIKSESEVFYIVVKEICNLQLLNQKTWPSGTLQYDFSCTTNTAYSAELTTLQSEVVLWLK